MTNWIGPYGVPFDEFDCGVRFTVGVRPKVWVVPKRNELARSCRHDGCGVRCTVWVRPAVWRYFTRRQIPSSEMNIIIDFRIVEEEWRLLGSSGSNSRSVIVKSCHDCPHKGNITRISRIFNTKVLRNT